MSIINENTVRTHEMLQLDDLMIERYQRILNTSFSKEITTEFDMNQVGYITVSFRDGRYYIIDGQHRVYAARLAGIEFLMCIVHHGLSYEAEAELFVKLNGAEGEVKHLLAFDFFKAKVEAKNEMTLIIKDLIEKNGINIARGPGACKIQALSAIKEVYNKYGAENLDLTLALTMATWGGVSESLGSTFIKGMSSFVHFYQHDIKFKIFLKQFSRIEPVKILREADADSSPMPKITKMVNILFKYYNVRLGTNKLSNKHFKI